MMHERVSSNQARFTKPLCDLMLVYPSRERQVSTACCMPSRHLWKEWGDSNFQIFTERPVSPQDAGVVEQRHISTGGLTTGIVHLSRIITGQVGRVGKVMRW